MVSAKSHILIVEDDLLVSEVVAAALDDSYATSLVETSAAAAERLAAGGVDLMLLDCTLPGGVDAGLVPAADRAGVPVVFMSGDPQRIERLTSRPRPFILKPFTLSELLMVVENTLAGGRRLAV
jgi:DNA-binding response OmpR family regulator